jgi:hypothetical protein
MRITAFVFSFLLLLEMPAEAYVDPGTGSMLIHLLIGGAMAGLVLFRSGFRRMIGWFRRPPRDG